MSELFTVERLSLSRIGDALRDQLGTDVGQYEFPDDFEKAVVDIGFKGIVVVGDTSPYEEVIFIGNVTGAVPRHSTMPTSFVKYIKARFIKTTSIAAYVLVNQDALESVDFGDSITAINTRAFGNTPNWQENVVLPDSVTSIYSQAFQASGITGISGNNVSLVEQSGGGTIGTISHCSNLKTVYFPKVTQIPSTSNRGTFLNDVSLETVEIGSVGYPVTLISQYAFVGCTSSFTATIYTTGNYVDTLNTAIRSGADNATIVFKAAADTTYNGVDYSAGDTMLTSTP